MSGVYPCDPLLPAAFEDEVFTLSRLEINIDMEPVSVGGDPQSARGSYRPT
jgi:hypothetical protein